ncbi:hypothetical protein BGZ83_005145 [Gryganskiella cystojenkinii]|nr:hypothetical protein BGZ83_005145 [Gryganskiella cystojenkinii]
MPPPSFPPQLQQQRLALDTHASELALRNDVAVGLMSSPTAVSPGIYVSKFFSASSASPIPSSSNTSSNPYTINSNTNAYSSNNNIGHHDPLRRQNSRRSSISGVSGRSTARSPSNKTVSALSAMIATEKAHNKAIVAAAAAAHPGIKPKRPDIRPYYQSFGSMGLIYPPPRSMSYAGPLSTTLPGHSLSSQTVSTIGSVADEGNIAKGGEDPSSMVEGFPPLKKSLSVGKAGKKGFATRLRKLRQRRGSTSHGFTSGESDTENASPSTGYTPKSPLFGKAKSGQMDPNLPPPPPMRINSGTSKDLPMTSPKYAIPYGFGNMGVAPLLIGTKSSHPKNKTPSTTPTTTTPVVAVTPVATTPSKAASVLVPATTTTEPKDLPSSSTTRFKEMIKRNVGLSSAESKPIAMATTGGLNPVDDSLGLPSSTMKVSHSWSGLNELMPMDDQASFSSSSRLTRITGGTGTRRARLARKLIPGFPSPSNGEDNDAGDGPPLLMREHQHRHHSFLPHLNVHRRDHGISHHGDLGSQLLRPPSFSGQSTTSGAREYVVPKISRKLKEARQSNREPNVLLAELRPLPKKFIEAYVALQVTPQNTSVTRQGSTRRSQTTVTPTSNNTLAAPLGPGSNLSILPIMSAPLLRTGRIVTATNVASGTISARVTQPLAPPPRIIDPLGTKTFLFKSYHHSRFQGHYIFRILGDKVQYCKLPVVVEQACSQYFREADVTYRSLEAKTKEWREEKKRANAQREQEFREAQASQLWITPPKASTIPRLPQPGSHLEPEQKTISETGPGVVKSRSDILSLKDVDTVPNSLDESASAQPTEVLIEDEYMFPPGYGYERSNSDPIGLLSEGLRRELEAIVNAKAAAAGEGAAKVMSSVGSVNGDGYDDDSSLLPNEPLRHRPSFSSLTYNTVDEAELVVLQQEEERWVRFKEQQQLERIQRAYDHAHWLEVEQEHYKASRAALYGLELYLYEVLKIAQVEYETFDLLTEVEIRNSNKDSTLLTIVNGDKTNIMSLESPSLKQKYEFLNWVAVCLMDHGEFLEPDPTQCASIKKQRARLDDAEHRHPLSSERQDDYDMDRYSKRVSGSKTPLLLETPFRDTASDDSLLEVTTVKLALMKVGIRAKREQVALKVKEIENTLDQLDNLDDSAKGLMSTMQRATESQEVQTALHPSLTTGLTLAQTVECKIKDVNERIIVCTRIMGAARLNLNRLKYEIELEQRSMKHFRRYKIAIAIVSVLLLCLGYFLYHQRVEQRLHEKIQYIQEQRQLRQQRIRAVSYGAGTDQRWPASPRSPLQVLLRGGPHAADLPIPETNSPYFEHPVENPFEFLNKLQDERNNRKKFIKNKGPWSLFSRTKGNEILCGEELEDDFDEEGMCPAPKISKK